jgi:nickel-dependent lactate racemase
VVVVVSDVTRPIPYDTFLPALLREIEEAGVRREEILVLVATGMHRPSTAAERREMFGVAAERYRVEDHRAEDDGSLEEVPGRTRSGASIRVNRAYLRAGFRIVTGLVEPHFMAGFSGGRKAICPGLCSLDTVMKFHGAEILGDPLARNGRLEGNPCHEEALWVARAVGAEFSLNVVLDRGRGVVRAFAGDIEKAHGNAVEFVRGCACPVVREEADVVVTSCGGYPLDATFYQCVKGLVSCLPAVRENGTIVAFGSCTENFGSPEYEGIMRRYEGRWREFLRDIRRADVFTKDQWELQMQARALERVGEKNVRFVTEGFPGEDLSVLSVNGTRAEDGKVRATLQRVVDEAIAAAGKRVRVAAIPEGPYCAPLEK